MHAATPRLYFQTLCQREVIFRIISILNAGSIFSRHVNHGIQSTFFIFWTKGHKIVEILALLTTELSSFKIYKVGMLFCIL